MHDTFFKFFGLRENPFDGSLDPRYLFLTAHFQKTLDDLLCSIERGNSFAVLTGEIGTGKTFLIRRLQQSLQDRAIPAGFVFYTNVDGDHLFDLMLADFGIRCDSRLKSDGLLRLRDWLVSRQTHGKTPVLLIDEAQGLSDHAFREIEMLLNLETPRQKLLQIVLAGESTLADKLSRVEFRKLRQRITCRHTTEPFTTAETLGYIQSRLRVAGAPDDSIFAPGAIDLIDAYSRGIPRVINVLCEQALIRAFSLKFRPIPAAIVQDAAHDFQLESDALRPRHSVAAAAAGSGALLAPLPPELFPAPALDSAALMAAPLPRAVAVPLLAPLPEVPSEPGHPNSREEIPLSVLTASAPEVPKEASRVIVLPKPNRRDFLPASDRRLIAEFLCELANSQSSLPPCPVEPKVEPKPFVVSARIAVLDTVPNTPQQPAHQRLDVGANASPKPRRPGSPRRHPLGYDAWRDLGRVLFSLADPAKWRKHLDWLLGWLQHPVNPLQTRTRHLRGGLR